MSVATAVKAVKKRAERVVRRIVQRMKVSARRKVNEAYKKGQSVGYSDGTDIADAPLVERPRSIGPRSIVQ